MARQIRLPKNKLVKLKEELCKQYLSEGQLQRRLWVPHRAASIYDKSCSAWKALSKKTICSERCRIPSYSSRKTKCACLGRPLMVASVRWEVEWHLNAMGPEEILGGHNSTLRCFRLLGLWCLVEFNFQWPDHLKEWSIVVKELFLWSSRQHCMDHCGEEMLWIL